MFISTNGLLRRADRCSLSPANRSFRYGDGIFETIRVSNQQILWSKIHYSRLVQASNMLEMNIDETFTHAYFNSVISKLYQANHPNGEAARIRFSLFRNDGGYYTPERLDASFIIESEKLPTELYVLNQSGLSLTTYPLQKKPSDSFSMIKSSSALLYVMASRYRQKEGYDDCLILNTDGFVAEATSSNVFLYKDGVLYTPGLDQACVDGVMRRVICRLAPEMGYQVVEKAMRISEFEAAEELFLCNAISGVKWVGQFNHSRYGNTLAGMLQERINQESFT